MVGVGVLEAEVVFLDDVHGVEDPLVQLLAQGLFLQEVKLMLVHHANTERSLDIMRVRSVPPITPI